ncbi:MAG: replication factor C large subunit [Nanoarchaeota archaeon]|nr:replication factor C large subunit [Nanoarchaeota archaeon]MBU1005952.1 replication factor C large subunit [Nanoarchaeota archaeon]MBU1946160.1 replication factor C large subunit [Nanoarchaeota archaeon]
MIPLTKKYAPKSLKDIKGQDDAVKALKEYVANFKKEKKRAVWVYGPSGSGKTSVAYALAHEFSYEIIEVNASDFRNKEQIGLKVGGAVFQQSLFSKGKIILVDEVDGLSGRDDRGGLPELMGIIERTTFPIILTATNPWDFKFNRLRNKCKLVELKAIDYADVADVLKHICLKEGIKYEIDVIKSLARRAGGDCRAAINDLQTLTEMTKELTKESLSMLEQRSQEESMPNALIKIFKTTDPKIAIAAFENVKEDLNQQFLWIDENLPHEYTKPEDLVRAYDKLSKADVFNRRIRRWQHWRFLVYINALITAGVAVSKDEKYSKFVQYKPTGRLLKMWWAKQKSMKKKAIAAKIAEKTHSSVKDIVKDIEYFKIMFKKDRGMAQRIADYADLDKEEIDWLRK